MLCIKRLLNSLGRNGSSLGLLAQPARQGRCHLATWLRFRLVNFPGTCPLLFSLLRCHSFFIIHSMYFEWTLQGFNPGPGLTCSTHPNMASRIEAGIVLRGVEIPTGRRLKGIPLDWTAWQAWSWPHLA